MEKTQGQIEAFAHYEGKLAKLFSVWDGAALAKTVQLARETIERRGGDMQKARDLISDSAYGNVSLQSRALWRPVDDVIGAMQLGYT